jgi:NhaA family Na+:H+ antiporter
MARLVRRAARPLDRFFRVEAASGIVLLAAAAIALIWANSPWASSYHELWHVRLGFHIGRFAFDNSFEWFVNDVLMVIFFFVVGMEIRREIHDGELSSWRRATLPAAAAIGGMLVPAGIYLALAHGGETGSGWGVPMATDIAFAVGVLALLGNRVPPALHVLLLALAVIDDLGAILVIGFFYSSGVAPSGLAVAAAGVAVIWLLRAAGVRSFIAYGLPGGVVWAGVYSAGIHPTIAGVIVGLLTPVEAWLGAEGLLETALQQARRITDLLASSEGEHGLQKPLQQIAFARREAVSPAEFLIGALHPWVAYVIMPLFALANAGIDLHGISFDGSPARITLAIAIALVVGKPLGVIAASALAIVCGVSERPRGLTLRHLIVLGVVAGIGFTMSLFVAQLAFSKPALLGAAKLGVLAASVIAMTLGVIVGKIILPAPEPRGQAERNPTPVTRERTADAPVES